MALNPHLKNFLRQEVNNLNDNWDIIPKTIATQFVVMYDSTFFQININPGGNLSRILFSENSSASFGEIHLAELEQPLRDKIDAVITKIKNAV